MPGHQFTEGDVLEAISSCFAKTEGCGEKKDLIDGNGITQTEDAMKRSPNLSFSESVL